MNKSVDIEYYQFAKQFVLSTGRLRAQLLTSWSVTDVLKGYYLYHHPRLKVIMSQSPQTKMWLLGDVFDPNNIEATNQQVTDQLCAASLDFQALELQLASLSGRWLLVVEIKGEARIYPDAAGLKPVYYVTQGENTAFASQPALLEALGYCKRDDQKVKDFLAYPHARSWPVGCVPYSNEVKKLPSNHYLDVATLSVTRFWPNKEIVPLDVDSAAQKMNRILASTVKAIAHRHSCTLSLSGGFDSRMLFSSALEIKTQFNYFTNISDYSPDCDIAIPAKIAVKYGLEHKFTTKQLDDEQQRILAILQANVGGLYYDRSVNNLFAFKSAIQDRVHLPGSISEISRCYYSPYGKRFLPLSGQRIAALSGFKGNPYAEQAFSEWLATVPMDLNIDVLDLLYWEQRLGVWSATGVTYREGLIDQIPPMNNREYMATSLAVDMKYRLLPHQLLQKVIELNDPELLAYDFNSENIRHWLHRFPRLKYFKERWLQRLF